METFSEYLEQIDNVEHRNTIEEVLNWVHNTFPKLTPKIAWNQPMFTDHGTFIIGFSISKQHLAVSPEHAGIIQFSSEIKKAGFDHTKQIVRFPWNKPIDFSLLERMIQFNIEDKADYDKFWR